MIRVIENKLCKLDFDEKTILKSFEPFSRIEEFKKVRNNCIIVREEFLNDIKKPSNIYCLDDSLNILWFSESPFPDDSFANNIRWDLEFYETKTGITYRENKNCFVCSTWQGITVNIDYKTGQILKKILTK